MPAGELSIMRVVSQKVLYFSVMKAVFLGCFSQSSFDIPADLYYCCSVFCPPWQALALSELPPTHIFEVLKQLCLSILQVACVSADEAKKVGRWVGR